MRGSASVCLEQLAERLDISRGRCAEDVTEAVAEAKRHAKALGERISLLRPSWRGQG